MPVSDRLSSFKNRGKDVASCRIRRKEDVIELRKARKEENLSKRRNISIHESESEIDDSDNNNAASSVRSAVALDQQTSIDSVVQGIHSTNFETVLANTQLARRLLSKERDPPIDAFIEFNAVPRLVELLTVPGKTELQFEAAWALTNIASGTSKQTGTVVAAGACPLFISLLLSEERNVAEQALWALANVAGDGPTYRDMLIELGIVPAIARLADQLPSNSIRTVIAWCVSNLCRNKNPRPPFEALKGCLSIICKLITSDQPSVITDVLWSLSYISDGPSERIQLVIDANLLGSIITMLQTSDDRKILAPGLRTLGNIVAGDDKQTQAVIDSGALPLFRLLIAKKCGTVLKEIAWILSNVAAGSSEQIQALIDSGLLSDIYALLAHQDLRVKKEAVWIVSNMCRTNHYGFISAVVKACLHEPLIGALEIPDSKIKLIALEAFKSIISTAQLHGTCQELCDELEELGFVNYLEHLQSDENEEVYKAALELVELYWSADPSEVSDLDVSSTSDNQTFAFNVDSTEEKDGHMCQNLPKFNF